MGVHHLSQPPHLGDKDPETLGNLSKVTQCPIYCPVYILHKKWTCVIYNGPGIQKMLNKSSLGVKLSHICDPVPRLLSFTVQSPASQSVVQALAALASSGVGGLPEMQVLRLQPRPSDQNPHLHKTLGHLHSERL